MINSLRPKDIFLNNWRDKVSKPMGELTMPTACILFALMCFALVSEFSLCEVESTIALPCVILTNILFFWCMKQSMRLTKPDSAVDATVAQAKKITGEKEQQAYLDTEYFNTLVLEYRISGLISIISLLTVVITGSYLGLTNLGHPIDTLWYMIKNGSFALGLGGTAYFALASFVMRMVFSTLKQEGDSLADVERKKYFVEYFGLIVLSASKLFLSAVVAYHHW